MQRTTGSAGKHRPGRQVASGDGKGTATGRKKRGFFRRWWWAFVLPPVVVLLALGGTVWYVYANTSIPPEPPPKQTTFLYDRNGKLIATLHSEVNRVVVPLTDMSPDLQHAVIAVEDRDFYNHGGVSFWSIIRAGWQDVVHRGIVQGGSTITQQYVKNVYTGSERTFGRKVKEAVIAVKLDHKYTKDQILEKYLNIVYFGNGAYGAEAAARTYWGIHASKLDALQSATLAGLIQSPADDDPIDHPDQAKARRNLVLDLMAEQGYISQAEAADLKTKPVEVAKAPEKEESTQFGYFTSYVSHALQGDFGYAEVFSGGLRVTTTLDSAYQRAAEKAVADHLSAKGDPDVAVVSIDPSTGEIRAMVGGKNFDKVKLNAATQAHRQAGSAFKPFTLAAAVEQRISPKSVWNGPSQIDITDPQCKNPDGTDWQPHNFADESGGTMNLLEATAHSVNTIFAQLVVAVGPEAVVDVAHRMGIQSDLQPVCSITLGTQEVTPLEMANAFATLTARGTHHPPTSISLVKTPDGKQLFQATIESDPALGRNDADLVNLALQGVIDHGTGVAANIGRPAAGKTGTTQDFTDAWFCGSVPQLTTCVWVGYNKGRVPMHNIEGFPDVFGGSIPAEIWHDYMSAAVANLPVKGFATPSFDGYDVNPKGAKSPSPSASPSPTESNSPTPPSPSPSPSSSPSPSPSSSPSPSPSASPSAGDLPPSEPAARQGSSQPAQLLVRPNRF
jgi:1A family penicillin-binding protein